MQLGRRLAYVLDRFEVIAMYMLEQDKQVPTGMENFINEIKKTYHAFIEEVGGNPSDGTA